MGGEVAPVPIVVWNRVLHNEDGIPAGADLSVYAGGLLPYVRHGTTR